LGAAVNFLRADWVNAAGDEAATRNGHTGATIWPQQRFKIPARSGDPRRFLRNRDEENQG
jgi:hypothetical protein